MTVLTETTKVAKVDAAFSTLVEEYMDAGDIQTAKRILGAADKLTIASKVRLFDILTKT